MNDVELRPSGATLGESFRKAGYATGHIGKCHIFGSPEGKAERQLDFVPEASRFGFSMWQGCECTNAYNKSLHYAGSDRAAPDKYRAMYGDRPIALRANVPADKVEEATKNLRCYYAHIAALDACVARLRQAVAESGQGHNLRVCLRPRGHAAEPRDAL